jgi:hypothetical protein
MCMPTSSSAELESFRSSSCSEPDEVGKCVFSRCCPNTVSNALKSGAPTRDKGQVVITVKSGSKPLPLTHWSWSTATPFPTREDKTNKNE